MRSNFNVRSVAIVLVLATLGGGLMLRGFDKVLMRQIGMSQAVESGNGTAGRSMYYDMAFDMAKEQPLGVGLNNWSWVVSADSDKYNLNYEPYPNTYAMSLGKHAVFAHSLYALTLGETGWIGLFLLLALWCQWLFLSGRNLFERNPDFITQVGIGCFFSLVVLMVNNITECNFRSQYIFILANVLLGYIVAIKYHKVKLQKNGY